MMKCSVLFAAALACALPAMAQLSHEVESKIDALAMQTLQETGVPSASVAVLQNGKIVLARAYGLADIASGRKATASMAYPIGSISKQFTAQAILLLQQRGKLSIDDPVAKYFPSFTRANDVTLRNLMTMTSGYEDFAPQDYIIPAWRKDTDPLMLVTEWATKPLDFEPGTQYQYSNTNYVILGLIVQKVSGETLMHFVRKNLLDPLHLPGVFNTYAERQKLEVTGYVSNAMAPVRMLPLEGNGWYFGDGDLAMPASSLALWDEGIIKQKLLTPESYRMFETPFVLKDGKATDYALGTTARDVNGHLMLEHSGEVGGYVAENMAFPADDVAIVVLTNEIASDAASNIARGIAPMIIPGLKKSVAAGSADPLQEKLKSLITQLQAGTIDRSMLTSDTNAYFDADTLGDFQHTLAPLGAVKDVTRTRKSLRGGMTMGIYRVTFASGESVIVSTYLTSDGKLEQLLVVGKG